MSKIQSLVLIAGLLSVPASGADKSITAGEAAALIVTDFCGVLVGESPDGVEQVASSIPGLSVSRPMSGAEVPEPFRSQFQRSLNSKPQGIFRTISFEGVRRKSGVVLGLIDNVGTMCQTTALDAPDTARRLEDRLKRADSGWQIGPPERDATVYLHKASTGRGVGIMFLDGKGITVINTYLRRPEPGSATPELIEEFATDVMRACTQLVLGTGSFDSKFFEPRSSAEIHATTDGPIVMKLRQKVPTAVVGLEYKSSRFSCRIISGEPVDAVPAIQAALLRAFMALPGAKEAGAEGTAQDGAWRWSISDAATGKKARMKIEPLYGQISAFIEPVPGS